MKVQLLSMMVMRLLDPEKEKLQVLQLLRCWLL